jgi:prolyl oligopeptidase
LKRSLASRLTALAALCLITSLPFASAPARAQGPSTEQPDNYTWLEDIHGNRPMEWVKAQN